VIFLYKVAFLEMTMYRLLEFNLASKGLKISVFKQYPPTPHTALQGMS